MKLLLIRHGEAKDRAEFAKSCSEDALRPLTQRGRRRMKQAARGLARIGVRIDLLATSPLTRAWQTAKLVAASQEKLRPTEIGELAPGSKPMAVLKWLQHQEKQAIVALVGHEPDLGILAGWLMSGLDEALVRFKKGAACMLRCEGKLASGHFELDWLLGPRHLRRLG